MLSFREIVAFARRRPALTVVLAVLAWPTVSVLLALAALLAPFLVTGGIIAALGMFATGAARAPADSLAQPPAARGQPGGMAATSAPTSGALPDGESRERLPGPRQRRAAPCRSQPTSSACCSQ
jgi:hypothetical protein